MKNYLSSYQDHSDNNPFEELILLWKRLEEHWNSFFSFWENELQFSLSGNQLKIIREKAPFNADSLHQCVKELNKKLAELSGR